MRGMYSKAVKGHEGLARLPYPVMCTWDGGRWVAFGSDKPIWAYLLLEFTVLTELMEVCWILKY